MKRFKIRLKGVTPLLHHRMTEDAIMGLLGDKASKKKTKEVLTPREIAEKHAYQFEDGTCYIPTDYITGAFMHVSSDYKQSNSQRKSYKSIAAGIFMPEEEHAVLIDEKEKPIKSWEVDLRKGTNHQKGAVAICRPRFERWNTEFTVKINTDLITPETALAILNDSGIRAGIGSFRVAKSGRFGQYVVSCMEPLKD
jgi:hypothetical protein